ncbi:hypothetical protein Tco_1029300 [Tanacetum coccineum]|uniref:Uncharacterized protein n=1 Tax=Tanacetum coccineum TaxID=301880 RepID=A0ABQ5G322_9ASTR
MEQTGCYKSDYECSFFFYPSFSQDYRSCRRRLGYASSEIFSSRFRESDNVQGYVSAAAVNYNQGNTGYRPQSVANQIRPPGFAQPNVQNNQTRNIVANPRGDLKANTTRSGISYDGPPIPPPFSSLPKVVERVPEVIKDMVQPSTKNIQPPVVQTQVPIDEPVVAPKPKPSIPDPSRANKQKVREKDDNLASKFVEFLRNYISSSVSRMLFYIC